MALPRAAVAGAARQFAFHMFPSVASDKSFEVIVLIAVDSAKEKSPGGEKSLARSRHAFASAGERLGQLTLRPRRGANLRIHDSSLPVCWALSGYWRAPWQAIDWFASHT